MTLYNDTRYSCGISVEQNKDVTKIIDDIALCRYYGIAGTELSNIIFLLHSTSDTSCCADICRVIHDRCENYEIALEGKQSVLRFHVYID